MSSNTGKTARRRRQRQRRAARRRNEQARHQALQPRGAPPLPKKGPRYRQLAKSVRPTLRGRGSYYDDRKMLQKGFAPDFGTRLGSLLGEGVQSLGEVLGFGDYAIKSNSIAPLIAGNGPPSIANFGKGEATVMRHREYIGDLRTGPLAGSSTAYTVEKFAINPGNSSLFPILANIAENFQFFEMYGMIVELKSESSTYAADMAMGAMFVATDYNTLSPPPYDKQSLLNMEFSTSTKPSQSQIHLVECARNQTVQEHLYVANDEDYNGGDAHFYNLGNLYVGSYGCPKEDTKIAEIWVSYEIALFRPKVSSSNGDLDTAIWQCPDVTIASPFGTGQNLVSGSAENYVLTQLSPEKLNLTLPNRLGAYLFSLNLSNTSMGAMTLETSGVVNQTGCNIPLVWPGAGGFNRDHLASPKTISAGDNYAYEIYLTVDELSTNGTNPNFDIENIIAISGPSPFNLSLNICSVDRDLF